MKASVKKRFLIVAATVFVGLSFYNQWVLFYFLYLVGMGYEILDRSKTSPYGTWGGAVKYVKQYWEHGIYQTLLVGLLACILWAQGVLGNIIDILGLPITPEGATVPALVFLMLGYTVMHKTNVGTMQSLKPHEKEQK